MRDLERETLAAVRASPCPFARTARVVVGPAFGGLHLTSAELATAKSALSAFSDAGTKGSDTLVLPVTDCSEGRLEDWRSFLFQLLTGLGSSKKPLAVKPDWDFVFHGQRYFVMVFAPCYPGDHPRHSALIDSGYVIFHPERAFRRYGISSKTPRRDVISERVRLVFARHGRPYPATQIQGVAKALRYIKPLSAADPPIRWFERESAHPDGDADWRPNRSRRRSD